MTLTHGSLFAGMGGLDLAIADVFRFVEWMMCLPDGWVTDVPGVTRNQALRALGNGVVPEQAAAALRVMAARAGR